MASIRMLFLNIFNFFVIRKGLFHVLDFYQNILIIVDLLVLGFLKGANIIKRIKKKLIN